MSNGAKSPLGDLPGAWMKLMKAQMDLGRSLFESVYGTAMPGPEDTVRAWTSQVQKTSCHIPPPCWMPQPLGECVSHVQPCTTACVRLVVTNCDRTPRTVVVKAQGPTGLTVTPPSVTIGPMDCATIEVCLEVPKDAKAGDLHKTLVWVEGCKLDYLVWKVSVGTLGYDSCHEVEVQDCPDYIHHWYDHFYCRRPCFHGREQGKIPGVAAHG